jgi:hypothetical protein
MVFNGEPMKSKRTTIGIVFSSMDRYELTRLAMESMCAGIDPLQHEVTVFWQDGSLEAPSIRYFEDFQTTAFKLVKDKNAPRIGATRIIERGMDKIKEIGQFDWIGLVESDVNLSPDWLSAMLLAAEEAKKDGLNPGLITPFVLQVFVAEYKRAYSRLHSTGASSCFFTSEAWGKVPSREIGDNFHSELLLDFGFPGIYGKGRLPYDCVMAPSVYEAGFDVIGTPVTKLFNCGIPRKGNWALLYVEEKDLISLNGSQVLKLGRRDYKGWMLALKKDPFIEKPVNELNVELLKRLRGLRTFFLGR